MGRLKNSGGLRQGAAITHYSDGKNMFEGKADRLRALLLGRVVSLAVQAVVFWLVLAALGFGLVEGRTWAALHGVVALGMIGLRTAPCPASRWRERTWLVIAFYAAFLAAFFAGANFGLDALHGVHRRPAEIGLDSEGLALWQFLCPGVFSLAAGALADCSCVRRCADTAKASSTTPSTGSRTPPQRGSIRRYKRSRPMPDAFDYLQTIESASYSSAATSTSGRPVLDPTEIREEPHFRSGSAEYMEW